MGICTKVIHLVFKNETGTTCLVYEFTVSDYKSHKWRKEWNEPEKEKKIKQYALKKLKLIEKLLDLADQHAAEQGLAARGDLLKYVLKKQCCTKSSEMCIKTLEDGSEICHLEHEKKFICMKYGHPKYKKPTGEKPAYDKKVYGATVNENTWLSKFGDYTPDVKFYKIETDNGRQQYTARGGGRIKDDNDDDNVDDNVDDKYFYNDDSRQRIRSFIIGEVRRLEKIIKDQKTYSSEVKRSRDMLDLIHEFFQSQPDEEMKNSRDIMRNQNPHVNKLRQSQPELVNDLKEFSRKLMKAFWEHK